LLSARPQTLFGAPEVVIAGNGYDLLLGVLNEGYDAELIEGEIDTADVIIFAMLDWADLDLVPGARRLCGAPCAETQTKPTPIVRRQITYVPFQSMKVVFIDLNPFARITDDGTNITFTVEQLSCLQEVLVAEVKLSQGIQDFDCLLPFLDKDFQIIDSLSFYLRRI
jgi:hypothetical protein